MKVIEALRNRRAVRAFAADPVDREVLTELAGIATLAPSHMNLQPWSFTIVDDRIRLSRYGEAAKQYLLRNMDRSSPFFGERDEIGASHYNLFYDAPALILICATRPDFLSDLACAMAAQNLMLAAHTMGLGTCWVSQSQPWLNSEEGRKELKLPHDLRPVAPIIIGCPSGEPLSPGRFKPQIRWT